MAVNGYLRDTRLCIALGRSGSGYVLRTTKIWQNTFLGLPVVFVFIFFGNGGIIVC